MSISDSAEYDGLIAATAENYRDWIRRVVRALASMDPESEERRLLKSFLSLAQRHTDEPSNGVLSTAMVFLDSQDYEKRPWEDDSDVFFAAMDYSGHNMYSLFTEVLAHGTAFARSKAAKWIPKYIEDSDAVSLLTPLLDRVEEGSGSWAALHLSRLAPDTPGLWSALVKILQGKSRFHSPRLYWDFTLTGSGEAAEALGRLGALALPAIPDLVAAIRDAGRGYRTYDGKLAARAVARIAGIAEALPLLEPLVAEMPAKMQWMTEVLDEFRQAAQGLALERSPDDPAHACFFARFLWRPGEDDYWKFRTRDARGAY